MFVEGEVEIKVKDRATLSQDEHGMKLWLQRAFKDLSCYRVSNFRMDPDRTIHAVVAIKLSVLPPAEQQLIETHHKDVGLLRSFIEKMFDAKGTCRSLGEPKIKPN